MFPTPRLECCLLHNIKELGEPQKEKETDLVQLCVVFTDAVISWRPVLNLILSVGKLYSALRSASEKVVSLHVR